MPYLSKTAFRICTLLVLLQVYVEGFSQSIVTYAGQARAERFYSVMELSDGTFVVTGSATDVNWLPATATRIALSPLNIDNQGVAGAEFRVGFLLHLSADVQQILAAALFPVGAVIDVTHVKTNTPTGAPTGDLFISGATSKGYFLAKLNGNFVDRAPTGLSWAWNVVASGDHRTRQPWDVGGDGKIVYAAGTPDGDDWAAVYRLRTDGSGNDIVTNWRYHFGIFADRTPAEGAWAPAFSNPQVTPTSSAVVFKTDTRGSLRSWSPADYNAVIPDGNGGTKQGQWPMDYFYAGPFDPSRPQASMALGGYTGYRLGGKSTHRIGGIAVDKRNGDMYIGASINSVTSAGQPDFEPFVIAYTQDGRKKWWSRLYSETTQQSPPDQFVDALAVDYSQSGSFGALVVVARQHGNAPNALWSGNDVRNNPLHPPGTPTFHSQFTGTNGNIQVSWIGKLRLADGTLLQSAYIAGFNGGGALGAPYTDPLLDGWPNHNEGWPDLNTARSQINITTDGEGNIYLLATARAFVTTSNAYQKHQKPANGPSAWADNVRVFTPDLKSLVYSSALTGVNPEAGTGGGNTRIFGAWPVRNGVILTGYQFGQDNGQAQGSPIPVSNIPPWGIGTPSGESAILAKLTFSDLEALFTFDPPAGACVGEVVTVTDSSYFVGSEIVAWEWNFGEGASPATATGKGPHQVRWATPGSKTVTLTVRNAVGEEDVSQRVYQISDKPTAVIETNPTNGNLDPAPISVALSPQGGEQAGLQYTWEIINPVSGTVVYTRAAVNHVFPVAGDYEVRLSVANGNCTAADTVILTVTGGPGPIFPEFVADRDSVCLGAPVLFTQVQDTNVVRYNWQFGEGAIPNSSNTAGPHSVIYSTPGQKTATLTVSNGVIEQSFSRTIFVSNPASAAFTATGATNAIPATIAFAPASTSPGASYEWNFGHPEDTASNTSTDPNPSYVYNRAGNYIISLTVTTPGGCSSTFFDSLRIEGGIDTVAADFEIINSAYTCVNNTVTLTDMSRGYRDNQRTWYFDDPDLVVDDTTDVETPINSPGPINVYWTTPGLKRIVLIVSGAQGDDDTKVASLLYRVFPYPNADFTFSGSTCTAPATLTFTPNFAPGNYYEWDFGDGSGKVVGTQVTHTFQAEGEYPVTLTVTNAGGCKSIVSRTVVIGSCAQPPVAGIRVRPAREDCTNNRYIFESASLGTFTKYEWEFGTGMTPSEAEGPGPHEITVDRQNPGPFTVKLTVTDAQGNTYVIETEVE